MYVSHRGLGLKVDLWIWQIKQILGDYFPWWGMRSTESLLTQ